MKADLCSIADGIAQALRGKHPAEADKILPISVEIHQETDDNPTGIILKTRLICDRLYRPMVDRETIAPADIDAIVSFLIYDLHAGAEREDLVDKIKSDLKALNDLGVEMRLMICSKSAGSDIFAIGARILSDALERGWQWHYHTHWAVSYALSPILSNEIKRREIIGDAEESNIEALKCCPVLLNAILADPDFWKPHVLRAFKHQNGNCIFKDGVLKGLVLIAPGIRWTGQSLRMREQIPQILKSALIGRSLHDVIMHPLLPDLQITEVRDQKSTGEVSIQVVSNPVPFKPVANELDLHGGLHK